MNSTSLAIIQPQELDTIQRAARLLAVSNYFDGKGDNPQAIAMLATKIMAGRELGFGPFASANGIHIISGRPSVGANLMAAAVKGSGRYDYRVRELTSEVCRIEFFQRAGEKLESLGISEFSKADAATAGTKNMDKFPKNMLFARAMSNGVRFYVPDVFGGNAVYVPEELGAEVDGEGNVIEVVGRTLQDAPETSQQPQDSAQDAKAPATPFDDATPYYRRDWQRLTGKEYDLVKWVATLHDKSDGPCTPKQYQYLTGLVDALTNSEHKYALSLLCQSEISSDNMPGRKVATELIKILVAGSQDYRQDICEMIAAMAQVAQQQETA